jgi:hypothetical protein
LSTAAGLGPRRSEAILTPYSPTPSVPVPPLRRDLGDHSEAGRHWRGCARIQRRWAKQAQRGDAVPVGGGETCQSASIRAATVAPRATAAADVSRAFTERARLWRLLQINSP